MQCLDGDVRTQVHGAAGGKYTLVTDVVDREDATRRSEDAAIPGVGLLDQQRRERRVPVVRVHYLWREVHALAALERGSRQRQVADMLVGSVGIDARTVEQRGTVDQVHPQVGVRHPRGLHVVEELVGADSKRERAKEVDRMAVDASELHLAVQRDEHAQVVAAPGEVAGQRCRYVAEPAGLRERRILRRDETKPHPRSLPLPAWRQRWVATEIEG